MQRVDVDLGAIPAGAKDSAQRLEDALARLLRSAAAGADNCRHLHTIAACCETKQPLALRCCAFSLLYSCSLHHGDAWGSIVKSIISEVKGACAGATGAEKAAAAAVRALASVPCVWLRAHAYDLCDALRDAASSRAANSAGASPLIALLRCAAIECIGNLLIDCDRLPLFSAGGDDKLELSLIQTCASACNDACDDVAAAGLFVCGSLLSVTPGCEHISHAFSHRSPLLGPSSCGLRVSVQSPQLIGHALRARCQSTASALASALPSVANRFLRLSTSCTSSSVLPLCTAINGIACVFEERIHAGEGADCPRWMQPSPKAAAASLITEIMGPLLHAPDAITSSNAACAMLRCCSSLPISSDCVRACCFALIHLHVSSPGSTQHAIQHEFIVAEIVAAWPRLPSSTRVELFPSFVQMLAGCERHLCSWAMSLCSDAWLSDSLTLSPPCLFFAPTLMDIAKPSSSQSVAARTPFLVALLDALSRALSKTCSSADAISSVPLSTLAVETLDKLWHCASWEASACYAYVNAVASAVAAETKRYGADFESSSSGSTLQAILLKLLELVESLSSPAAVTRALLLLSMHLPLKRNLESNVAAITRCIFNRMCHTQPPGQEGLGDAALLLPALARLGSRGQDAHSVVCSEVNKRLNHELQEPLDNPALKLFNDVAAASTMNSVRSLLKDIPALRAWSIASSPFVILEHPPSLPPSTDVDEHAIHSLSKRAFAAVDVIGRASLVDQQLSAPQQVSGSMDLVRVFMQHIAQTADQLVTVVVTLAFSCDHASEIGYVRVGCNPGPFSPAVGSCVGGSVLIEANRDSTFVGSFHVERVAQMVLVAEVVFDGPFGSQKQTCSHYMVPLSHMLHPLPPPPCPLRPAWSLLRASQLWWVTCPLSLQALCQQVQRRACFSVDCITDQQLLLLASSWGGVTLGIAFTVMQGSGVSGAFVYQAQVSTSSSRVAKILSDSASVRALIRDACACEVSLSVSPPTSAVVGSGWGCSDSAAIAGQWRALKASRQTSIN